MMEQNTTTRCLMDIAWGIEVLEKDFSGVLLRLIGHPVEM